MSVIKCFGPGKKPWTGGAVRIMCASDGKATLFYKDGKTKTIEYALSNAEQQAKLGHWNELPIEDWFNQAAIDKEKAKAPAQPQPKTDSDSHALIQQYRKFIADYRKANKCSREEARKVWDKMHGGKPAPAASAAAWPKVDKGGYSKSDFEGKLYAIFEKWWSTNQSEVMFSRDIFMAGAKAAAELLTK